MWYNCSNRNANAPEVLLTPRRALTVERLCLSMATPDSTSRAIEIPLSGRYITIIDECDADLALHKWSYCWNGSKKVYATRRTQQNNKKQDHRLNRVILERILGRKLLKGEICDHRNGNTLDNRRDNLRLATHAQNTQNSRISTRNTSGYKGVSYVKADNAWRASICVNGEKKNIGQFRTPEDAYNAYCKAAIDLHGEFANLGEHHE